MPTPSPCISRGHLARPGRRRLNGRRAWAEPLLIVLAGGEFPPRSSKDRQTERIAKRRLEDRDRSADRQRRAVPVVDRKRKHSCYCGSPGKLTPADPDAASARDRKLVPARRRAERDEERAQPLALGGSRRSPLVAAEHGLSRWGGRDGTGEGTQQSAFRRKPTAAPTPPARFMPRVAPGATSRGLAAKRAAPGRLNALSSKRIDLGPFFLRGTSCKTPPTPQNRWKRKPS